MEKSNIIDLFIKKFDDENYEGTFDHYCKPKSQDEAVLLALCNLFGMLDNPISAFEADEYFRFNESFWKEKKLDIIIQRMKFFGMGYWLRNFFRADYYIGLLKEDLSTLRERIEDGNITADSDDDSIYSVDSDDKIADDDTKFTKESQNLQEQIDELNLSLLETIKLNKKVFSEETFLGIRRYKFGSVAIKLIEEMSKNIMEKEYQCCICFDTKKFLNCNLIGTNSKILLNECICDDIKDMTEETWPGHFTNVVADMPKGIIFAKENLIKK